MDTISKLDRLIALELLDTKAFRKIVWSFFKERERSFAWRETYDPYEILVSEVMLQQTQTDRVARKYPEFLRKFPTVEILAQASTAEVIAVWQGLGYYRRALNLQRAAQEIVQRFASQVPSNVSELQSLPGIGPYTAAAIAVFAYGRAVPMIETNIRAVYLYSFFPRRENVADGEILELVKETIDRRDTRRWFYALMDLGAELKRQRKGINHQSKHHTRQSAFEGSHRQVRAAVLRVISERKRARRITIERILGVESSRVEIALSELEREGFLSYGRGVYCMKGAL
jgi:A/G-specific adenine glycosylase